MLATKKGKDVVSGIAKVLPLLRFLSLLCEGHYEFTQNIMREQERNVVTVNLLGEVVDMLFLLGKSLPALMAFQLFECELL